MHVFSMTQNYGGILIASLPESPPDYSLWYQKVRPRWQSDSRQESNG